MSDRIADLTRPIIGIENRTAQEAFDIMADRIRGALSTPTTPEEGLSASDERDLAEMITAWRSSLANPASWMERLRGLLRPAADEGEEALEGLFAQAFNDGIAAGKSGDEELLAGSASAYAQAAMLAFRPSEGDGFREAAYEARSDAFLDFFNEHLTDGNDGYIAAPIIGRCRAAFERAWEGGREPAFEAARAALKGER